MQQNFKSGKAVGKNVALMMMIVKRHSPHINHFFKHSLHKTKFLLRYYDSFSNKKHLTLLAKQFLISELPTTFYLYLFNPPPLPKTRLGLRPRIPSPCQHHL